MTAPLVVEPSRPHLSGRRVLPAVMHGDVAAAARALLRVPRDRRAWVLHRMFAEAERADAARRATGRMHPLWGDGSLMAAALRRCPAPEPALEDPTYCRLLAFVYLALAHRANGELPLGRDCGA